MLNYLPLVNTIANIVLLALFLVVFKKYLVLDREYKLLHLQKERLDKGKRIYRKARKEAKEIVNKATLDYQEIVKQASIKSGEILERATKVGEEESARAKMAYESVIDKNLGEFSKLINEMRNKYESEVERIISGVNISGKEQTTLFNSKLESQFTELGLTINKIIEDAQKRSLSEINLSFGKAEEDIERYKMMRYEQIDSNIALLLENLFKDYAKKAINPKDQEEIIISLLENAKRSNLL
jgi:F0F1-type ATP synthase membrane subunit b/b'